MTQHAPEQLSALVDGELAVDEARFLHRRLQHDHALSECWARYHVVRHVLRRQELVPLRSDFSALIAARLELEGVPAHSRVRPVLRWVSGGAIAASVAVAALMVTGPGRPGVEPAANDVLVAATGSLPVTPPSAVSPVPSTLNSEFRAPLLSPSLAVQPASAATSGFANPASGMDPHLQSYLLRHYDASQSAGQGGLVPYVLLIVPAQQQVAVPAAAENSQQRR
ncbi:MAG: sigma-E factor negative regulatory protein [Dokdonella sp.]